MARYTSGKMKAFFYIAVMLPMWASYIVKAYAWVLLLAKDGVAQWFLGHLGLEGALNALLSVPAVGGNTLSTSGLGRFLVFVYIWLPFMILPVQAALERIPGSLLQASADLGAAPRQTFRYVVLPLAIPGIAAGSIFTFSLTLGDFIVPQLVGPPGYFIGNMVYSQQGGDRQYADGGGVYPGAYRLDCPLSGVRETSGSLRCTLNARPGICDWRPGAG